MEKFILGLAIGMVGGGLIVANNCKVRGLVKKNGDEIMSKLKTYIDEQMQSLSGDESGSEDSQNSQEE